MNCAYWVAERLAAAATAVADAPDTRRNLTDGMAAVNDGSEARRAIADGGCASGTVPDDGRAGAAVRSSDGGGSGINVCCAGFWQRPPLVFRLLAGLDRVLGCPPARSASGRAAAGSRIGPMGAFSFSAQLARRAQQFRQGELYSNESKH